MYNNIPDRDTRKKYIKNNDPKVVRKYINNLGRLSQDNPGYKKIYQEDLDYFNQIGGFLTNGRYGTDCNKIRDSSSNPCKKRATDLLEINDKIDKYIREGKIPLRQAQKTVKEFLDTCLCCDNLYNNDMPENTIINLMSKILKKITSSIPLLEYAFKYVLPIYFSEKDRIFNVSLYESTKEYMKDPNNITHRRSLKQQIIEQRDSYKTITTGIITAIFMAVEKKFH